MSSPPLVLGQAKRQSNEAFEENYKVLSVTKKYRLKMVDETENYRQRLSDLTNDYFEEADEFLMEMEDMENKINALLAIPKSRLQPPFGKILREEITEEEEQLYWKQPDEKPAFFKEEYERSMKLLELIVNLWKDLDFIYTHEESVPDDKPHFRQVEICHFWNETFTHLTLRLHDRFMAELLSNTALQGHLLDEPYLPGVDWKYVRSRWNQVRPGLQLSLAQSVPGPNAPDEALYLHEIFHWSHIVNEQSLCIWLKMLRPQLPFTYEGSMPLIWFKEFASAVVEFDLYSWSRMKRKISFRGFILFSHFIEIWGGGEPPTVLPDFSFLSPPEDSESAFIIGGVIAILLDYYKRCHRQDQVDPLLRALEDYVSSSPNLALISLSEAVFQSTEAGHVPGALVVMDLLLQQLEKDKNYKTHLDKENISMIKTAAIRLVSGYGDSNDEKKNRDPLKKKAQSFVPRLNKLGLLQVETMNFHRDLFFCPRKVIKYW